MRILIVEDDQAVAQFMAAALNKNGHVAETYNHAGMAMGAVVRGKFELLICDLMLPNIHGIDAIKMIRSQFPYLPIIVVSGLEADEWEPKSLEAGASCFMQKPVRLDRFLDEVKLVQDCQVDLAIGIVDPDRDHRERLAQNLGSIGCEVRAWDSIVGMLENADSARDPHVVLIDGKMKETQDAIVWANGRGAAAVAFDDDTKEFDQDKLMRWGACFCLTKPVDSEALVTQARFFVAPTPKGALAGDVEIDL